MTLIDIKDLIDKSTNIDLWDDDGYINSSCRIENIELKYCLRQIKCGGIEALGQSTIRIYLEKYDI